MQPKAAAVPAMQPKAAAVPASAISLADEKTATEGNESRAVLKSPFFASTPSLARQPMASQFTLKRNNANKRKVLESEECNDETKKARGPADGDGLKAEKCPAESTLQTSQASLLSKTASTGHITDVFEQCVTADLPAAVPTESGSSGATKSTESTESQKSTESTESTFLVGKSEKFKYSCTVSGAAEGPDYVGLAAWLERFNAPRAEGLLFCGLDCEWCPPWWQKNGTGERVDTIQLYAPWAGAMVFSTGDLSSLPTGLVELLQDKQIIKLGVNVYGDATRLRRDFGAEVRGLHDIASKSAKSASLESLVARHCPKELHINKAAEESQVRLGNWAAWPLTREQVEYAALDAVLSFWGFAYSHGAKWGEDTAGIISTLPADLRLQDALLSDMADPDKAAESDKVPAGKNANANFYVMHRNKSIVPPNLNKKDHPQGPANALKGICICISGVLDSMNREDMTKYVTKHGGTVVKAITKKVTYLVNDHGEVGPSKRQKCEKMKVSIVSEDAIFELVRAKM